MGIEKPSKKMKNNILMMMRQKNVISNFTGATAHSETNSRKNLSGEAPSSKGPDMTSEELKKKTY